MWSPTQRDNVVASILYYGTTGDGLTEASVPVLGHFAEDDPYETAEWVAEFEDTLRKAGRDVTIHRYPATGHWFAEPSKEAYRGGCGEFRLRSDGRLPHSAAGKRQRMTGARDPRVDAWIEALPDWQAEICRVVRELIHEADPEIEETIKRTTQPYFVLHGNVMALQSTKHHVNVFLYDPGVVDPDRIITDGFGAQTGRQIKVTDAKAINEPALLAMLREIIGRNRAGGWRKLQEQAPGN